MSKTNCYRCKGQIDHQKDEWWSYSWEEQPSEENIDKAIESDDFRDWFRENKVICPDCHDEIQDAIQP